MRIRRAKKSDLEEIDKIYIEGSIDEGKLQFPKTWKKLIKEFNKFKKERINGWKKELRSKDNYWIVIEDKNLVAGFGNAEIKRNFNRKEGMINMVYIDRGFRKNGLGSKILKELIKWLRKNKIKIIEAGIYWNNKPSIRLNEKFGFKPISVRMRLK